MNPPGRRASWATRAVCRRMANCRYSAVVHWANVLPGTASGRISRMLRARVRGMPV